MSEIKYYLKDLNLYGGLDSHNIFSLFLNKMVVILAPKLAKFFRGVIAAGSFPAVWRTANITPIPEGTSPSQFSLDYRPTSITPFIFKAYEKLISWKLYEFVDFIKVLSNTQFDFRKELGATDVQLLLTYDLQYSLDKRTESKIVSFDVSFAFDLVTTRAFYIN